MLTGTTRSIAMDELGAWGDLGSARWSTELTPCFHGVPACLQKPLRCASTRLEKHLCRDPGAAEDASSLVQRPRAAKYDAGWLLLSDPLQIPFYQTSFLLYASVVYEGEVKPGRWLLNTCDSRELVGNFEEFVILRKDISVAT